VTTVDAVRKDHSLIQFALLGLSCTDQLGNRMFEYDVRGAQDLDAEGINDRRGYYFSSILYHSLGLPNEALHNIFQSNCALEHGVSFRGLRQMVRYNYEKGDYTLVKKYCILLKHSMFNDKFADSYLALADTVPAIVDTSFNLSRTAPVCDHNKKHELITLFNNGYSSRMIVERILCYQLAEGDVESFRTNMELFVPYYREVPRHFMEAMELTPVIPGIGENLYYKYIRRMNESLAATDDTQKI